MDNGKICPHCGEPVVGPSGKVFCSDVCRKAHWYLNNRAKNGSQKADESDETKEPTEEELLVEVAADQKDVRQRSEAKYWKQKYDLAIRVANTQDMLEDALRTCVAAMPVVKPATVKLRQKRPTGSHSAVVVLSDLHIGENVDIEQTGGLSEFNMRIFRNRLGLWVDKVIELVELRRTALRVSKLVVLCAGDIISGDIHDELVKTNVLNVMDQAVHGGMLLSHALAQLSQHFEEIKVVGVVGNHGRTTRKKESKDVAVSWDHLAYQLMAANLRDYKNISFSIPKSFYTIVQIENTRVMMLHGDNIRGWSGFPWYGTSRAIRALRETLAAIDQSFDVVVMGHFHQALELDMPTGPLIVNSSWKGGDEFSVSKVYAANKPSQTLFYVHETEGVVARELIFLTGSTDEHGKRFPEKMSDIWAKTMEPVER